MGRQQRSRAQRRSRERQARRHTPPPRSKTPWYLAGLIAVLVLAGAVAFALHQSSSASPPKLTPTDTTASLAASVDGIQCGAMEALAYHIHQHLTLYKNGKKVQVPAEIGIPGGEANATCFYWIHVHALTPGIIHVESPVKKIFTLGNFFDIWRATKDSAIPSGDAYVVDLQKAAARGQVTAFLNGKRWHGSYRSIPLRAHAVITVEIGRPVIPPKPFTAWNGL